MAKEASTARQHEALAPACPALLLLGPTGSGKTPLGRLIHERGLWGRRMVHFDFGATLRTVVQSHCHPAQAPATTAASEHAESTAAPRFSPAEIAFLENILRRGLLLEDQHFCLAERLLRAFLQSHRVDERTWVVLNGLPRHVGQARALVPLVDVRIVVVLDCPAETALERIRRNVAGDRTERADDEPALVARKLAVYEERTAPLLAHYRQHGARVERLPVGPTTTPAELREQLAKRNPVRLSENLAALPPRPANGRLNR